VIDHQLTEWGRDPATLEDEGVDPPPPLTVQKAIRLAEALRDEGMPNPQTVVGDPNGGIVLNEQLLAARNCFTSGTMDKSSFGKLRMAN